MAHDVAKAVTGATCSVGIVHEKRDREPIFLMGRERASQLFEGNIGERTI
jgi:hypothetical protein